MAEHWWERPLRIVQVNLQVADTPLLDPDEVMRQLARDLHANCVVFNAGGIYAWYPTQVPHHVLNPYLEGRDLLGESVEAAHRYGMRYIARVGFHMADESVYHQHPEWFAKDAQGQPRVVGEPRFGPWSLLYATCTNGAYCGEAVAFPALEEILAYDVDGLFYNAEGYRECHCGECRRRYRALYGEDLPDDPRQFRREWATHSFLEMMTGTYRTIKARRPDVPLLGRFGLQSTRSPRLLRQYGDVPFAETQDQFTSGYLEKRPAWFSGMTARLGRTVLDGVPPIVIVHACSGMPWRHTALPEPEHRLWLAQVAAHGGNVWHTLTGIPNTQYDQRILQVVGALNRLLEAHEDCLAETTLVAPVAIVYSAESLRRAGTDELFGCIEALLNHQIPFTFLPVEEVTPQRLAAFDVVVLPNVNTLEDAAAAALRAYAQAGGGLVTSFETGLYDPTGRRREVPALDDVLGVETTGHYMRGLSCSYMRVEAPEHPLLEGIRPTQFIANELDVLQVTSRKAVPLTLVPPFATTAAAGSPPERASLPVERTAIPLAVCGERSVYFPGEIGRLVWKYRLSDHQVLLANAVRAVASRPLPIEVTGSHALQMSLYRQGAGYVLHLVNATGERPLQDTTPLHDVGVTLRGVGAAEMRATAVIAGAELATSTVGGDLRFTIPVVQTWEIVRIAPA